MAMSTPFFGRWLVCFKKAVVLRFGRLVAHRAHLKNRKFMQRLENNFESTLKYVPAPSPEEILDWLLVEAFVAR